MVDNPLAEFANLKDLVTFCKREGISRLSSNGTEIEFAPGRVSLADGVDLNTLDAIGKAFEKGTEDFDPLFHSAPEMDYADLIGEKKE